MDIMVAMLVVVSVIGMAIFVAFQQQLPEALMLIQSYRKQAAGVAMEQTRHKQTVCTEQQSEECTKLIRKLRWLGMEQEAHHLQMALCTLPPHERYAV